MEKVSNLVLDEGIGDRRLFELLVYAAETKSVLSKFPYLLGSPSGPSTRSTRT